MKPKSEEFKTAMSIISKRIADAKRRGTRSGFIDYHGCISVCRDFIEILEETGKAADRGEFAYAYSVAALIHINTAKLASTADDSAGGITDTKTYIDDLLEKVCSGVEYGSDEASYIFSQSLKDSQDKAFDGWAEFSYDLLRKTARLATEDNVRDLFEVLDSLYSKLSEQPYSSWYVEPDALTRLEAISAVRGEVEAAEFIKSHLDIDGIREAAINQALAKRDFALAESLCLEKLSGIEQIHEYSSPSKWRYLLFDIYERSGDTEKKIAAAGALLFGFDTKYYAVLKRLLTEKGVWEQEYPGLLVGLGQSLPYHKFMDILSKEGETSMLLEETRKHPSSVFTYGKQLSADYPNETFGICLDEIRKQADEADNRTKYKKVCGNIKKLFEYGGVAETDAIIPELKGIYPRRPALLEELDSLRLKLAKKRK